ncbi:MAG TPA: MobF family relaxase [Solirubrobacteraceae bacterium]|jgi:conjugative relaxase-like TrwC/TraI family protein|nr:MobF family relaxase [Solirubrobacteraceae bacterium]
MTASSIGSGAGGGYARYLEGKTIAPERGDYYLTPAGDLTEAPGRWLSGAETLERLGIDPGEAVAGEDFIALMEGRHPATGAWLRPAGADGTRGGGIDVTFSAPKSVSVVWALGDPWQREQIAAAHARAVERAVDYLKERVPVVRRRYEGQVVEEHATDVIATAYGHTTARGVSGAEAPDPQLHTHVVLTGAVREDGRFVAVASRPLFRGAREVGAFYRSALAQELAEEGYPVDQGTGNGGRYFEIAGVPRGLMDALSGRHREIAKAAEAFRARHGRAPVRGELRALALENRRAKELTTRADLQRVWRQTGREHDFGADEAVHLVGTPDPARSSAPVPDRIEARLVEREAVFEAGLLRAVALEQSAGELTPDAALQTTRAMLRERRVLTLEGGRMTTLAVRAQEEAIERRADELARPANIDVGEYAREAAAREIAERIGAPLSREQQRALRAITGPERLGVLIGPAGTGKGVVIDAAARAEQLVGHGVIGIAVSGSTAERLGQDSPTLTGSTLTLDAFVARADSGRLAVNPATRVILDEAGMVDHHRMEELTEVIERTGAKLVIVGDGKQLPSIGPGGMFDRIAGRAPKAELSDVRRTTDPDERKAWAALRNGEPERAMAHYRARGQLYFADTRDEAGEAAVQRWAQLTRTIPIREVALIADASNIEIDRLSARAQHLRAERGELGASEIPAPGRHYGLREGDLVTFGAQHHPAGEARIENGSRGEITHVSEQEGALTVTLDGSDREIRMRGEDLEHLRLAYAQHVYRQQGATVERSVVVTGGWQTSKESSYVEASRARHGTEWFLARDELGSESQDERRIEQLANMMRTSRAHTPSLLHREVPNADLGPDLGQTLTPSRNPLAALTPSIRRTRTPDRAPDHER